jgi:hypothetical protein
VHPGVDAETRAIRKGIYLLPNLLTTAALFAGFFAVVAAMDGNFQKAAVAIFVARSTTALRTWFPSGWRRPW